MTPNFPDASLLPRTRCPRCHGPLADGGPGDAHDLAPDDAIAWGMAPGRYHERCCPECNGLACPLPPFGDFVVAADTVVGHLQASIGFDLWAVTRVRNAKMEVVAVADRGYGIGRGDTFHWSETICARMVADLGPRVASDVRAVPAYTTAPMAASLPVGAYAGVPLESPAGALAGTLFALHPVCLPAPVGRHQGLVELQARLLSTLLPAGPGA